MALFENGFTRNEIVRAREVKGINQGRQSSGVSWGASDFRLCESGLASSWGSIVSKNVSRETSLPFVCGEILLP
jgi:hypothetical protein